MPKDLILLFLAGIFSLITNTVASQPDEILLKTLSQQVQIDVLGQIYVVNHTEVTKFNSDGTFLYRYSNSLAGNIYSIDVENPLKVMLFYKEANLILFLDAQLAEIGSVVAISSFSNFEAEAGCSSATGNFWLYHPELQQINHYQKNLQTDWQTPNLSYWLQNDPVIGMREADNHLYVLTPQKLLVFDCFGNFKSMVPTPDAKNGFLYVPEGWFFFNDSVNLVNLLTKELTSLHIPTDVQPDEILIFYNKMMFRYPDYIKIIPFQTTHETNQ